MILEFQARQSTHDLDGLLINALDPTVIRKYAKAVAEELNWPADWLNDGAKGFIHGQPTTKEIFSAPGIRVVRPGLDQLLAMKLCAWRDDVDIADADRLLRAIPGEKEEIWLQVQPFLQPGKGLKARYAFDDLWEAK